MLKILSMATLLLSTYAQAGSWSYSCQSTDGEVTFTREELTLNLKNDDGSIGDIIYKQYNDDFNGEFKAGGSFRFKDDFSQNKPEDVIVSFEKILSESTVEENTECPPGDSGSHGPGYSTTTYKIEGSVQQYDNKMNKTYLCHETFAWSGRCHFDSEENQ